jgi:DNA-binding response OmpR family regulator
VPNEGDTVQITPERTFSILMVEDDWSLSVPYGRALEAIGFKVSVADSGQKAIETAASSKPDLIVLDLTLPDQTGFDVLRELRAAPVTAALPIVILSGNDAPTLVRMADELGVLRYLVKLETSPKQFAETLKELLPTA